MKRERRAIKDPRVILWAEAEAERDGFGDDPEYAAMLLDTTLARFVELELAVDDAVEALPAPWSWMLAWTFGRRLDRTARASAGRPSLFARMTGRRTDRA